MSLSELLIYGADWRLQAGGGLLLLAAMAVSAVRLLGFSAGLRIMAAAGAVFAALAYGRRERQQGWKDAQTKGERDAKTAIGRASRARADAARRNADARRLRDDDGHRRD